MKKFYRSKEDQRLAGICGAIGEIYKVDSNLVRLGTIFAALVTQIAPVVVTYLIAWVILPEGEPE
ncbi:PspC domain-containing protein [Candidatus Neomarinimicrobiota bacterium]